MLICLLVFHYSCKKNKTSQKAENKAFYLELTIEGLDKSKGYLESINESFKYIDSAIITNNKLTFKGNLENPSRFVITIDSIFGGKLIVLENDSIFIKADNFNLVDATILNSEINTKLVDYQKESSKIFKRIELLFPDLQRARLNNDINELNHISDEMEKVIIQNTEYNYAYCEENLESYISAMILNDLSNRDSIDFKRIEKIYTNLSDEVKSSIDSKELEIKLFH